MARTIIRLFECVNCFKEAIDRLRHLADTTVWLETGPRETDRYGRMLYYIYTVDCASIAAVLVREGLARARTRDGQHRDTLVQLEREAQESGAGCLGRLHRPGRRAGGYGSGSNSPSVNSSPATFS